MTAQQLYHFLDNSAHRLNAVMPVVRDYTGRHPFRVIAVALAAGYWLGRPKKAGVYRG